MPHELLDKKSVEGIRAIRDGQIAAESLPGEGGRWGLSVVFAPKGPLRDQLADVTTEAAKVTGEHHWRTGSEGAAHLTVRALEPHTKRPLSTKIRTGMSMPSDARLGISTRSRLGFRDLRSLREP
jgi:hypothetical protein